LNFSGIKALGISGVITREFTWNYKAPKNSKNQKGAQIDLIFDRDDSVISLCEIKCHNDLFTIDKKYASELKNKISTFQSQTNTSKTIFLVMITVTGLNKNMHYQELIDNELTLKDFFC